jgi:predicted DNA-binding protein (UPF0251 family)
MAKDTAAAEDSVVSAHGAGLVKKISPRTRINKNKTAVQVESDDMAVLFYFIQFYIINTIMVRPRLKRRVRFRPKTTFFKPRGIPMRVLQIIKLTKEEIEALRLRHLEDLEQEEVAKKMETSRPTVQRILNSGHKKIVTALTKGKAIAIEE